MIVKPLTKFGYLVGAQIEVGWAKMNFLAEFKQFNYVEITKNQIFQVIISKIRFKVCFCKNQLIIQHFSIIIIV